MIDNTTSDFKQIVLDDTPLIDVRAPIEYTKGAFLNSINIPILNDDERKKVGIAYKQKGNQEAVKLGYKLLGQEIKQKRVDAWIQTIKQNPKTMLYCFRGGQRSQIAQNFIKQEGVDITRLKGGYKAFRNYLLDYIENSPKLFNPYIIGGRSGSGKTVLLNKLRNSIDLERLANHKGSAFGRAVTPQPTQINFENNLAYNLIKKIEAGYKNLIFEDEGKFVGSLYIPKSFASYLLTSPLIILQEDSDKRVQATFDEYIVQSQNNYQHSSNHTFDDWVSDMQDSINRIRKRIGGQKFKKLNDIFTNALKQQQSRNSLEDYKNFVEFLLLEYYDPMYDYQISKRSSKIVFQGTFDEILEYINSISIDK